MQVREVPIDRIDFAVWNRRALVDAMDEGIQELSESIAAIGQSVPAKVAVYPGSPQERYPLVYGHRRWLALKSIQDRTGTPQSLKCLAMHDPTESQILQEIAVENGNRQDFLPSERAKLEVEMRNALVKEGKVSTRDRPLPGRPSYASLRASQLGVSERIIEHQVRLGEATPALLQAADDKTVTITGAYSLAAFDPSTQVHVVSYLQGEGVTHANPRQVAAVVDAVRNRQGLPAVKHGATYEPSLTTQTLAEKLEKLSTENAALRTALDYYAQQPNGSLAQDVLDSLRDGIFIARATKR